MALDQLPEELLLTIGDHLPNQPLRPCSRSLQNAFELPADPKWRQYDPQRVRALWKSFLPIENERCYDLVLIPFDAAFPRSVPVVRSRKRGDLG